MIKFLTTIKLIPLKCFIHVYPLTRTNFDNLKIHFSDCQFLTFFIERYFPCPLLCYLGQNRAFGFEFGQGLLLERQFLELCRFDHFLRFVSIKYHHHFMLKIHEFFLH